MKSLEKFSDGVTIDGPAGEISQNANGRRGSEGTSATLEMPNLGTRSIYAATAKSAGRLNATAVSVEEHHSLLEERQNLLNRKFEGSISRKEENRLAYVRWSLDRIEDAKYGVSLDLLEEHVERYENVLSEINKMHTQFQRHAAVRRR